MGMYLLREMGSGQNLPMLPDDTTSPMFFQQKNTVFSIRDWIFPVDMLY
jgi:hypothetical protein